VATDPELRDAIRKRLKRLDRDRFGERLWQRDAALFKSEPEHQEIIRGSLGWLAMPEAMATKVDDITSFAASVAGEGYRHAVLLGMGGSSLAPEVLRRTYGVREGFLDLLVCDSTDPAAVRAVEAAVDLDTTLFIVASKSGGTTETADFHAYFFERLKTLYQEAAGRHFVAITDPETTLHRQALEQRFRAVFLNPPDIGGRYSALSYFGLVPAALTGLDLARLLEHARHVASVCGASVLAHENPAVKLGAALGEAALAGRDKLTLVTSPALASFGPWLEQLVAESTGKEETGIVPVDGEPIAGPEVYDDDRVFVYLRLSGEHDSRHREALHELSNAGHPVISLALTDLWDVGGEFLRWEIATAAAGVVLGIDPFDQPNVQESKDLTKRLLAAFVERGKLPQIAPGDDGRPLSVFIGDAAAEDRLREHLGTVAAGDYVAIQAYLPPSEPVTRILQGVRVAIRDRFRVATTVGYGPRYLHSTGQLHKGGKPNGVFLQLTCGDAGGDLAIPGRPYSFGVLKRAQARGDLEALRRRGLRVLHVDLGKDPLPGVTALGTTVASVLRQ
jgi:transaldolase/glucose-6-phosphate isomerase